MLTPEDDLATESMVYNTTVSFIEFKVADGRLKFVWKIWHVLKNFPYLKVCFDLPSKTG